MAKFIVKKVKGSKKPFGKKKSGYGIYLKGKRVRPFFANFETNKAKLQKKVNGINKDTRGHR